MAWNGKDCFPSTLTARTFPSVYWTGHHISFIIFCKIKAFILSRQIFFSQQPLHYSSSTHRDYHNVQCFSWSLDIFNGMMSAVCYADVMVVIRLKSHFRWVVTLDIFHLTGIFNAFSFHGCMVYPLNVSCLVDCPIKSDQAGCLLTLPDDVEEYAAHHVLTSMETKGKRKWLLHP